MNKRTKSKVDNLLKKLSIPRYTGSANEILAQKIIINELKRLKYQIIKQKVVYQKSDTLRKLEYTSRYHIILFLVIISAFLHPLIILSIFAAYFYSKFRLYPRVQLLLSTGVTHNLTAQYVNDKSTSGNKIVLCAHYDTAKVMRKSIEKQLNLFFNVLDFTDLLTYSFIILLILLGIISGFVFKSFFWQNGLLSFHSLTLETIWLFLLLYFFVINMILTYFKFTTKNDYSSGANDNASGVYTLLKIADAIKELRLKVNVDFVFFAAEEIGHYGSRNWVQSYTSELDKNKVYFINVDSVGNGSVLFVNRGMGYIIRHYSNEHLVDTMKKIATRIGFDVKYSWGAFTDEASLLEKDLQTCNITIEDERKSNLIQTALRKLFFIPDDTTSPLFTHIHSQKDEYCNINMKNINNTIKLLLNFIVSFQRK